MCLIGEVPLYFGCGVSCVFSSLHPVFRVQIRQLWSGREPRLRVPVIPRMFRVRGSVGKTESVYSVSHNVFIKWFWKVNSPTIFLTYRLLLLFYNIKLMVLWGSRLSETDQ